MAEQGLLCHLRGPWHRQDIRSERAIPPLTRLQPAAQTPVRCQAGQEGLDGWNCSLPVQATFSTMQCPILSPTFSLVQAGR